MVTIVIPEWEKMDLDFYILIGSASSQLAALCLGLLLRRVYFLRIRVNLKELGKTDNVSQGAVHGMTLGRHFVTVSVQRH